jgi:glycine dehydrogenase subunit 1
MSELEPFVHPYIPNSAPAIRAAMLKEIGVASIDELYAAIPEELRLRRRLNLPEPFRSELGLQRHVEGILAKNRTAGDCVSFLGGGCWQHFVPAVCEEIAGRAEFLTAYGGDSYADLGKYQALFEFQSLVGELVGMEVVSAPTYDWAAAASSALLMATRITGRPEVLVPRTIAPERLAHLRNFALPAAKVGFVSYDPATGLLDLGDLQAKLSARVAAVYVEIPSYLGFVEAQAAEIAALAHATGALSVVGVDPSSLGVLAAPSDYGADLVCGEAQPLGVPMHFGGGLCGFIASRDEPAYVREYPTYLISVAPTSRDGELAFAASTMSRTSYDQRGEARDYTGTTQWLWGIAAAVYLALLGPRGMRELGEAIMQKSHYAVHRLSQIEGIQVPRFGSTHFKEFVVSFDRTGRTVSQINRALLARDIFGGKDLSADFPELGNSALYCVTDVHTREQIDRLTDALEEVLQSS